MCNIYPEAPLIPLKKCNYVYKLISKSNTDKLNLYKTGKELQNIPPDCFRVFFWG